MSDSKSEKITVKDIHSLMSELAIQYPKRSRILDLLGRSEDVGGNDRVYILPKFKNIDKITASFKRNIFRLHFFGVEGIEIGDIKEYFDKNSKPTEDMNGVYGYLFTQNIKGNECRLVIYVPSSSQDDRVKVDNMDIFCSYEKP